MDTQVAIVIEKGSVQSVFCNDGQAVVTVHDKDTAVTKEQASLIAQEVSLEVGDGKLTEVY